MSWIRCPMKRSRERSIVAGTCRPEKSNSWVLTLEGGSAKELESILVSILNSPRRSFWLFELEPLLLLLLFPLLPSMSPPTDEVGVLTMSGPYVARCKDEILDLIRDTIKALDQEPLKATSIRIEGCILPDGCGQCSIDFTTPAAEA